MNIKTTNFCYLDDIISTRGDVVTVALANLRKRMEQVQRFSTFSKPVEVCHWEQKTAHVLVMYKVLCYMEVRLGQLKRYSQMR